MKSITIYLPIVLSVIAMGLSVFTYAHADALADAAFKKRERAFIEQMTPAIREIYPDFDMVLKPEENHPQTLEQLLTPMLRLIQNVNQPCHSSCLCGLALSPPISNRTGSRQGRSRTTAIGQRPRTGTGKPQCLPPFPPIDRPAPDPTSRPE